MVTATDIAATAEGFSDLKQGKQLSSVGLTSTTHIPRPLLDNTTRAQICSETMQPASAAFSMVEVDCHEAQLAMTCDTPDASFQHCDDVDEDMLSPRSSSDSDLSDEDQHAYPDWQKSLQEDSLLARYRHDNDGHQQVRLVCAYCAYR